MTYNADSTAPSVRSRRALLTFAHRELRDLAERTGARDDFPYATVLRLINALIQDGSATPQISSNGDGGIFVEWLAGGLSLTIDYEDETEILIAASSVAVGVEFEKTVTAWWTASSDVIPAARSFLARLSSHVAHPISLT
ncbi:hypothetical protein AB2L57_00995 [Microbacterium sp. HA-8]|uniref:hypothetical protein n=1 Tax=Microbacterium sp. HA-8 TaxID=3234200 RepID=UPI0038F68804